MALSILGCPTPAQEGGLWAIDTAGLAGRLVLLCNAGHADPLCATAADASLDPDAGTMSALGAEGGDD
ncbi:MAG TPA: hypothetical protein VF881_08965 [Polyangiaceae bacterium]